MNDEKETGAAPPEVEAGPEAAGPGGTVSHGNQKLLLATGIAILSVVVVAASFGLGYAIGNKNNRVPALGGAAGARRLGGGSGLGGSSQGAGQQGAGLRGRLREMVSSGEASVVRGKVASVQDGTVTVETESGPQTVSVTEKTRYLSAGTGGSGGGGALQAGEQVQVLARKTQDGKLKAVAVRVRK